VQFVDTTIVIDGKRRTNDGYMVVDARVARTGVQRYLGKEVGKPELKYVDVYRSPDEVFSDDSLHSLAHRPITDDHPKDFVNSENWAKLAKGYTGDEVKQDGKFIRVPLMVADAETIDRVENGKRELSPGYTCDLKWGDGVSPEGVSYQAQQVGIRFNHLAIVKRGRSGSEVRIGDEAGEWGAAPITDAGHEERTEMSNTPRQVMVDGLTVETADNGATIINKLVTDRDRLTASIADLQRAHTDALATRDREAATKDAKIAELGGKVLDQAAIDKLVSTRVSLESAASKVIKDFKPAGLSDADVRRKVVIAKLGDAAVSGKSDDYVAAYFDVLVQQADGKDPVRDALRDRPAPAATTTVSVGDSLETLQAARQKAFDNLVHYDLNGKEAN